MNISNRSWEYHREHWSILCGLGRHVSTVVMLLHSFVNILVYNCEPETCCPLSHFCWLIIIHLQSWELSHIKTQQPRRASFIFTQQTHLLMLAFLYQVPAASPCLTSWTWASCQPRYTTLTCAMPRNITNTSVTSLWNWLLTKIIKVQGENKI